MKKRIISLIITVLICFMGEATAAGAIENYDMGLRQDARMTRFVYSLYITPPAQGVVPTPYASLNPDEMYSFEVVTSLDVYSFFVREESGGQMKEIQMKDLYAVHEENTGVSKKWTFRYPIYDVGQKSYTIFGCDDYETIIAVSKPAYVKTEQPETDVSAFENQGSFSPTPQQDQVSVVVNGQYVNFDVPPQIINGRTMVPVRAIFEALGATVTWNPETRRVSAEKLDELTQGILVAIFEIGSDVMINSYGEMYDLIEAPAIIIDGRTLVPARAAAEAFNCQVAWDASTRTVYIAE